MAVCGCAKRDVISVGEYVCVWVCCKEEVVHVYVRKLAAPREETKFLKRSVVDGLLCVRMTVECLFFTPVVSMA